jgi:sugar phosphate isomerase/epimerase
MPPTLGRSLPVINLSVPVADEQDIRLAQDVGADGVVAASAEVLAIATAAGLEVAAVRWEIALPLGAAPLPDAPEGTSLLVAAPQPRPEDLRSFERIKAFRLACVRDLQELGARAESEGLRICVPSGVDSFFEGSLELCEIIRASRSEAVLWTMNTCDAEACGEGVSGATDVGGDLLGHVVAEDWAGPGEGGGEAEYPLTGRCAPGQGGRVPFARLFEQLEFLEYEGLVEVAGPRDSWGEALRVLRDARGG